MIFLVVLMLGATTIMNSAVQDERITGNTKASTQAFLSAEAGQMAVWEYLSEEPAQAEQNGNLTANDYQKWNAFYAVYAAKVVEADLPESVQSKNNIPDIKWAVSDINNDIQAPTNNVTLWVSPVYFENAGVYQRKHPDTGKEKFRITSQGMSGRASRSVVMDLDGSPTDGSGTGPKAPAAISCFGTCTVLAGTGNPAPISGRNHPVPDKSCSGSSCWVSPYPSSANNGLGEDDPKIHFAVPSVYLTDPTGSTVCYGQNGKCKDNKHPFEGQDSSKADWGDTSDQYYTTGSDKNAGSVWTTNTFTDNGLEAPDTDHFVGNGNDSIITQALEKAESELSGDPDSPNVTLIDTGGTNVLDTIPAYGTLIIDGGINLKEAGNGFFAGLIIIRGCSSWTSSGNFSIYGAVIIDATDSNGNECGDDYEPFKGGGTPDVKYSLDALNNSGVIVGGGTLYGPSYYADWYEIIEG
jgi:Tfp pilus assembly protein PilX